MYKLNYLQLSKNVMEKKNLILKCSGDLKYSRIE